MKDLQEVRGELDLHKRDLQERNQSMQEQESEILRLRSVIAMQSGDTSTDTHLRIAENKGAGQDIPRDENRSDAAPLVSSAGHAAIKQGLDQTWAEVRPQGSED